MPAAAILPSSSFGRSNSVARAVATRSEKVAFCRVFDCSTTDFDCSRLAGEGDAVFVGAVCGLAGGTVGGCDWACGSQPVSTRASSAVARKREAGAQCFCPRQTKSVAGRVRGIHEQQLRSIWYCSSTVNGVLCFMKRELISAKRPARLVLAHWAVSAIALMAVIVVQVDWDSLAGPFAANNPPVFAGAVIIAATAWLLATAWLHASVAGSQRPLYLAAGRLRLHAITDLAIGGLAAIVLFQGHES